MNLFRYKLYGIVIESEFELPDLLVEPSDQPDVSIRYGIVPEHLPKIHSKGVLFEAAPNDFIFNFPSVGAYRIKGGESIIVQPDSAANQSEISIFLLGSIMGVLLHQRGMLPLHGSSIITKSGAVVITGRSSSGKSTLAAALNQVGFDVITDDISVISPDDNGRLFVNPGIPFQKLWKDTLEELNIDNDLMKVRSNIEKYKLPISGFSSLKPSPLHSIIFLSTKNSKGISHHEVLGGQKFTILRNNTYRVQFIEGLGQTESHFHQVSSLSKSTPLFKLERPSSPFLINELVNYLIKNLF